MRALISLPALTFRIALDTHAPDFMAGPLSHHREMDGAT
jgi:hypothetical protein